MSSAPFQIRDLWYRLPDGAKDRYPNLAAANKILNTLTAKGLDVEAFKGAKGWYVYEKLGVCVTCQNNAATVGKFCEGCAR